MEAIEHMDGAMEVFANGPDVRLGHVGGDGLDLGVCPPQTPPERRERLHAFALADEDDRTGFQVEYDGQIAVPFADVDLVNGDLLELVQLGLAETPLEMAGLDVLDR